MEMNIGPQCSPAVHVQRFARAFEGAGLIGTGKWSPKQNEVRWHLGPNTAMEEGLGVGGGDSTANSNGRCMGMPCVELSGSYPYVSPVIRQNDWIRRHWDCYF